MNNRKNRMKAAKLSVDERLKTRIKWVDEFNKRPLFMFQYFKNTVVRNQVMNQEHRQHENK